MNRRDSQMACGIPNVNVISCVTLPQIKFCCARYHRRQLYDPGQEGRVVGVPGARAGESWVSRRGSSGENVSCSFLATNPKYCTSGGSENDKRSSTV